MTDDEQGGWVQGLSFAAAAGGSSGGGHSLLQPQGVACEAVIRRNVHCILKQG